MNPGQRTHRADDLLHVVAPIVVIGFTLVVTQWRADHTIAAGTQMLPLEGGCFILLGLALLLFQSTHASLLRRRLVQCFSLIVSILGLVGVASHTPQLHLNSFVQLHLSTLPPVSALLLALAGLAILALTVTRLRIHMLVATWIAAILMISAALTVVGDVFGHPGFFHQQHLATMSLQTALLFSVIALDVLRLSRIKPLQVARNAGFISIAFIVIVLAGMVMGSIQESRRIQAQMDTTSAISSSVQLLTSSITEAESNQRGYIVTYDQSYLNSYHQAISRPQVELGKLQILTSDDATEQAHVGRLAKLTGQKLDEMNNTIQLRRRSGFWAAANVIDTNQGYTIMNDIETEGKSLQQTAQDRLSSERYQQQINNHHTMAAIFIGTVTDVILVALLYLRLASENRQRNLAQAKLRTEKNDALNARAKSDTILASIGDGVFALDPKGYIILFNNAASELTGYAADEALGKQYSDVLKFRTQDGKRRRDQFITQALEGKDTEKLWRGKLLHKDGHLVAVTSSAAPIADAQQQSQGAISVFREDTQVETS